MPLHAQIVVAGEADGGVLTGQVHAGVRIGAVADEIAQAPHLPALGLADGVEHRLERVAVAVDVGDDGDAHHYSLAGEQAFTRSGSVAGPGGGGRGRDGAPAAGTPRARASARPRGRPDLLLAPTRSTAAAATPVPSWGSMLARSVIEAAALAAARPPAARACCAAPGGVARRPAAGGAVTAAGLSLALSLPTLPLRAISRRRAIAVGLDTQSWGAWAGGSGQGRRDPDGVRRRRRVPRSWPAHGASRGSGGCRWAPVRSCSGPGWRRSPPSCSTRSSTTSSRCPRARRAPTCWSSPATPGSASARSTRSTPAGAPPPPTPT